jgi:hypothetical protein
MVASPTLQRVLTSFIRFEEEAAVQVDAALGFVMGNK